MEVPTQPKGTVPKMGVGYDPVQRAGAWRRRIEREEVAVCDTLHGAGPLSSADARLDLLKQTLWNADLERRGLTPTGLPSARGRTGGKSDSGAGQVPLSTAGTLMVASQRGESAASGRVPAVRKTQTPRSFSSRVSTGCDFVPRSSRGMRAPDTARSGLSVCSRISITSQVLKAELEEETRRRVAAEEELLRLQEGLNMVTPAS
eukprot:TRINITY_DN81687_c0_g1_i1.p1 TRINITY_DN81687_c0_g1~~TRINITY_DN81687_c0_g1_i1.p1  ORF type:complete len:204 (+),score=25.92 TRINITY_DN81687_c0_g1_i1:89-700(+)